MISLVERGKDRRVRLCQFPGLVVAAVGVGEEETLPVIGLVVAVYGQGKVYSYASQKTQRKGQRNHPG